VTFRFLADIVTAWSDDGPEGEAASDVLVFVDAGLCEAAWFAARLRI
jgi:hypothetical protein